MAELGHVDPGDSGGQTSAPGDCVDVQVEYRKVIPTVGLLIDRSFSMQGFDGFAARVTEEIASGAYTPWGCPEEQGAPLDSELQENPDWRWNVVRNVLFNPDAGVVPSFEAQVRFGMTLYTYLADIEPEVCPNLIRVGFSMQNSSELLAAMKCHDLGDKTPTRESLVVAAQALHEIEDDGPKMIILATDGSPNSCACPGFGDSAGIVPDCRDSSLVERNGELVTPSVAERFDLVQETRRIHDEWDIRVSVIDVSSAEATEFHTHLEEVAAAGGGQLYSGLDPSGLSEAFFGLVEGFRSCFVDLEGEIAAGKEDEGKITLDGMPLSLIPDGGGDGYRVVSSTRIELVGAPCELIASGDHELDISFPCDAIDVVK